MLGFVIMSMYYGPSMIIDKIGFNTFVTSFALQLSELLSLIPCYYYIDKAKRQTTGFSMFFITAVCSFVLILVKKPGDCEGCSEEIIEVLFIFFFRLALGIEYIMFMVYSIELFPTRIVGVASSAASCAMTSASTLSAIIVGALERL